MPRKPPPKPRGAAKGVVSRKSALQLRTEGHTFETIAKRLKITRQSAHELVQRELAEAARESRVMAHQILDGELERVDFVLRSMAPKVIGGDSKAATAYLRAMERRSKLLGLDRPEKHEHSGPDGGPIATTATAIHARLGAIAARATGGADADAVGEPGPGGAG